jgi:exopolysaccharide production protein ExoQ
MRISRRLLTAGFFFFVLFLSSGAMEAFTSSATDGADTGGSPMMKVLWACIYLIVLLMILRHRREVFPVIAANKAFVLLMITAVVSVQWSIDARITLSKALPLLLSGLVGLEFARRYTFREQLQLIWTVLALVLVLGVIAQVFFPGLVPNPGDDEIAATAWHGIVTTKNTWARLIVLAGVVVLSRPRPTRRSFLCAAILMVLIFALLVASQSTGGILIMAEMSLLFVLFRILRWRRTKALILSCIAAAGVAIVALNFLLQNFTALLTIAGKDPTMTGRLPIWHECLRFAAMHPLLGYGYSAFWNIDSRPARLVREAVNWPNLPHAHNGYIDLLLGLGCVGVLLYSVANGVAAWRAIRYLRENPDADGMWPLAFLSVIFLYQIDEGSIVAANQIIWILCSSVIFSLGIDARESANESFSAEQIDDAPVFAAGD